MWLWQYYKKPRKQIPDSFSSSFILSLSKGQKRKCPQFGQKQNVFSVYQWWPWGPFQLGLILTTSSPCCHKSLISSPWLSLIRYCCAISSLLHVSSILFFTWDFSYLFTKLFHHCFFLPCWPLHLNIVGYHSYLPKKSSLRRQHEQRIRWLSLGSLKFGSLCCLSSQCFMYTQIVCIPTGSPGFIVFSFCILDPHVSLREL